MRTSLLMVAVVVIAGCGRAADETSTEPAIAEVRYGVLTKVADRSRVCMVNDRYMGRAQIPVQVGGRTYYGCCEMCKARLAGDPSVRSAMDPLSHQSVDKADAVIAKDDSNTVVYFESEANLATYGRPTR